MTSPVDEIVETNTPTTEDDPTNPAGEIRLSPARAIGLRVSALGGLAVGAIVVATPAFSAIHTTTGR